MSGGITGTDMPASADDLLALKLRIRALDEVSGLSVPLILHAILDELMFMQKDMLPARMLPRIVPLDATSEPDEAA